MNLNTHAVSTAGFLDTDRLLLGDEMSVCTHTCFIHVHEQRDSSVHLWIRMFIYMCMQYFNSCIG